MTKFIQIAVSEDSENHPALFALADDGTVWHTVVSRSTGKISTGWCAVELPANFSNKAGFFGAKVVDKA